MDRNTIDSIWNRASAVDGYDGSLIRMDSCGAWILKAEYGNMESEYGWAIDHVFPVSRGGDDSMINLRPMQWRNNMAKASDFPVYYSAVIADGSNNVPRVNQFKVSESLLKELRKIYVF